MEEEDQWDWDTENIIIMWAINEFEVHTEQRIFVYIYKHAHSSGYT